ncbi:MAG: nucleotidyltransferase domain-containing protein [Desulfitobacterium sp.]|nr:nucleotidyltransferase domain-containing protein [Desulfitobacterium sp.]
MIFDNQPLNFRCIRDNLKKIPAALAPYSNQISAVLLFGSLALDKETPLSDVDLAVYMILHFMT